MAKIIKKTMQMNQDYIDQLRLIFGARTDTETVNRALELALIDEEIIPATRVMILIAASSGVKGMRHDFASRCPRPKPAFLSGRSFSLAEWPL